MNSQEIAQNSGSQLTAGINFFSTDCLENIHNAINENICQCYWQWGNGKSNQGVSGTTSWRSTAGLATAGEKKKIHLVQSSFYGSLFLKDCFALKSKGRHFYFQKKFIKQQISQTKRIQLHLRNEIWGVQGEARTGSFLFRPPLAVPNKFN